VRGKLGDVYILINKKIFDANEYQKAAFNDMDGNRQTGTLIKSGLSTYGINPTPSTPIYDYQFNGGKTRFQLQQIRDERNGVYIYYSNKYNQRTIITEAQYILSDLVNVMNNEKIETLDNLSDAKIIDLIGKTGN
jgi:hypothetical protein